MRGGGGGGGEVVSNKPFMIEYDWFVGAATSSMSSSDETVASAATLSVVIMGLTRAEGTTAATTPVNRCSIDVVHA